MHMIQTDDDKLKEVRKEIREAVVLVKHMDEYTGGSTSRADFANEHLIKALNMLNKILGE
jgi:hypothetical protein